MEERYRCGCLVFDFAIMHPSDGVWPGVYADAIKPETRTFRNSKGGVEADATSVSVGLPVGADHPENTTLELDVYLGRLEYPGREAATFQ